MITFLLNPDYFNKDWQAWWFCIFLMSSILLNLNNSHPFWKASWILNGAKMSLKKPESTVNTDENDGNSFNAHDLLGEHSAAKIILGQEIYFLKLTKQNKLILTKW